MEPETFGKHALECGGPECPVGTHYNEGYREDALMAPAQSDKVKMMATKTHVNHRPVKSEDRPFFGAVSDRLNRAAHGGIARLETCSCGATRWKNVNGSHVERGGWTEANVR